jgi:hypothetical protein
MPQGDDGVFRDENVSFQNTRDEAREQERERLSRRRKGKTERPSYKDMDPVEYSELR